MQQPPTTINMVADIMASFRRAKSGQRADYDVRQNIYRQLLSCQGESKGRLSTMQNIEERLPQQQTVSSGTTLGTNTLFQASYHTQQPEE